LIRRDLAMPRQATPLLEGHDSEGKPWKLLANYRVYYGQGFHKYLYINKPEQKDITKESIVEKISKKEEAEKEKKRKQSSAAEEAADGNEKKMRRSADEVTLMEAEEGGFAADSQTRDRKSADYMNLSNGRDRDYDDERETTKRNKLASAKAAEEAAELMRDHAQLLRLLGEVGVTAVDQGNGDPEAGAVDLGSLADTLVKMDAGVVSESLLAKLIGVGLRAAEEQMQGQAAGLFPKLDAATVGLGRSKEEEEDAALGAAEILLDGEEVDSDWAETSDEEKEDELSEDGDDVEESNRSALAASHGHPGVSKGEWARARVAEVRAPVERQKQAEELRGALLHARRLQAEVRSLKSKVRLKVAKPTR